MPLPGHQRLCEFVIPKGVKAGTTCKNPALKESLYCRHHQPTVEKMEKERPVFGQGEFKLQLKEPEDQELFEAVLAGLQSEFEMNQSSDMINLEMATYYFVRWRRAVESGEDKLAISFDGLVQRNLAALQVTRSSRPDNESTNITPDVLAANLMNKAREYEQSNKKPNPNKKHKSEHKPRSGRPRKHPKKPENEN